MYHLKNLNVFAVFSMLAVGCAGSDGASGSSCTVNDTADGAEIVCSDGSRANVDDGNNGVNGTNGLNGADGQSGKDALNIANIVSEIHTHDDAFVIIESKFCQVVDCLTGTVQFATGSGTKTADGNVITAFHVVNDDTLLYAGSQIYSADMIFLGSSSSNTQNSSRDQATMNVAWNATGNAITGLTPRLNVSVDTGDLVVVVGHPGVYDTLSFEAQYTSGFVTADDASLTLSTPTFNAATFWSGGYVVDAVAWHGNSGGPVFNELGEWIGMLVGAYNGGDTNQGPDLSVVIPIQ